ncbi:hypothetical protein [Flavobacterium limi]|uniref:Outer membrane protein beta-barrel domain-containing protein n=1 Tax=Flavobacterium limi TaxID=2045105 RepID=A0ABQ1TQC9_9FLAO|nr:hypothetical protein [Flavobacterium limi]GGE99554.1 hypothetical protein GCM10011518_06220 [Flavobacterium limi]
MNKFVFILIFIGSQIGFAQNNMFSGDDYERINVEAGFVQPLGNLSNKFEVSPSFGFWFRNKIKHEDFVDFGFNFFIPKNPVDASFVYHDSIAKYKSSHFAINIGSRFAKIIRLSRRVNNFNVEWNSGVGLALNFYNAPNQLEFNDGERTKEVLTTFYVSQGIKLNYKNTGLQCHYQWSPYGLFNDQLEKDFGSQSLIFGIVYRQ